MLGRRRVFAVEPLGGCDGAAQSPTGSCVVPGVTSTYRRIPDTTRGCSSDSWKEDGEPRGLGQQVPVFKLASRDSGVEMAVGDSLLASSLDLASSLGLSQDSLVSEPTRCPESPATESSAHLGRLQASRKLEQVLERSRRLPTSPSSLRRHCCSSKQPNKLVTCEKHLSGAGEQEAKEAGLEEAEVVEGLGPEAWACLPGQGLRYLEHLCLVLEQVARLQQLCLQLQARRPLGNPAEEMGPPPPPAHDPSSEVHGPWKQLSQTKETGAKAASPPLVGVPRANSPSLSEAPAEPAHTFPSSQGHKVKVLLSRIRWRNRGHPVPPVNPDEPAPRTESRDLPERPLLRPHRKTFIPSLAVKKQRAKNLSVC
ncbi:uncharacterized protein C8orf58 homolog [Talpa occidentalis]|uniref:uncharacterized protein C8orf58 homolog n=1 Tax=Talpa occidentalis TaxID=50954 RepID=UPI0018902035|nr:uncharacterized protein C8orf58 homolog [Talpa occidentalis]